MRTLCKTELAADGNLFGCYSNSDANEITFINYVLMKCGEYDATAITEVNE